MIWVLVAVIVVLLVAVALLAARQRRSRQLQAGFGPEYQRVVEDQGDRRAAERELSARRERHQSFELRELDPSAREHYGRRWEETQRAFVDEPRNAVGDADSLVRQAMHDRGYPVDDDFEQRAADLSVDHPIVVENYRAAHAISVRASRGEATTEQLRQSMVHYRALFAELLGSLDEGRLADRDQTEIPQETTRSR